MHRFIPAKASAWSYAEPRNRNVRIDSLWGIPDGIQYYPHDTFEYDLIEKRIVRPTIDFKPYFIWPSQSGKWTKLRVKSQRGRAQSISKLDIQYIASYTAQVAQKIDEPTQIMWFCDFPKISNFTLPIPWYREQSTQRPMQLDAAPPLPEIIISSIQDAFDVKNEKSLAKSKLILHPNSEVIRSEEYLNAVIEAAKTGNHSVVLDGSILAHAFHQFSKSGISIFSSRKPLRRRTINKQEFGKLVRDKIPEVIVANGDAVKFGRVPKTEKRKLLIAKAFEELTELADAEEHSRVEELADLYEVFDAILHEFGLDWDAVTTAAETKRIKRGGFSDGIVLVGTNVPNTAEDSLLPPSTIKKMEVNPNQAINSASKIEKDRGGFAIPIIKLLSSENGVLLKHKDIPKGQAIRLELDGDRILLKLEIGPEKLTKRDDLVWMFFVTMTIPRQK